MIAVIAFYLFAAMTIASAVLVIFARNPVHSVLWLIVSFFSASGLMLMTGAEFIALLLVIVYVGAVAVLFLFVVMMLDIDFAQLRSGFTRNLPFGLLIALVLLAEIIVAATARGAGQLTARGGQLVDTRSATGVFPDPLRANPARFLHPMQRGVERALLCAQHFARSVGDGSHDGVSVKPRASRQYLEHQQIE